jgi:hypothetical protein
MTYTVWDLIPAMINPGTGETTRPAYRKCSYAASFTGRSGAESWVMASRDSVIVKLPGDMGMDFALRAFPESDFAHIVLRHEIKETTP